MTSHLPRLLAKAAVESGLAAAGLRFGEIHFVTDALQDLDRPERVFQLAAPDLRADFPPLRSVETTPNNLPVELTSFVGREREIDEIEERLQSARLLTLTGTGGCGKTRLALAVSARLAPVYPDGVWLVELAGLVDSAFLAQTVATTLRMREEPGRPLPEHLVDVLKHRHMLVVFDSCEHLVGASP